MCGGVGVGKTLRDMLGVGEGEKEKDEEGEALAVLLAVDVPSSPATTPPTVVGVGALGVPEGVEVLQREAVGVPVGEREALAQREGEGEVEGEWETEGEREGERLAEGEGEGLCVGEGEAETLAEEEGSAERVGEREAEGKREREGEDVALRLAWGEEEGRGEEVPALGVFMLLGLGKAGEGVRVPVPPPSSQGIPPLLLLGAGPVGLRERVGLLEAVEDNEEQGVGVSVGLGAVWEPVVKEERLDEADRRGGEGVGRVEPL